MKSNMIDENDSDTDSLPLEMSDDKPLDKPVLRGPDGKFLPGTARGPGRPHGSKGKLNKTVVDTLSAIWERRGMEVLEELADTNPAALAAIVSRLVPQDMVREAISGDEATDKANTDITIRLVQQVQENQALEDMTTRLVEGELLPKETTH